MFFPELLSFIYEDTSQKTSGFLVFFTKSIKWTQINCCVKAERENNINIIFINIIYIYIIYKFI